MIQFILGAQYRIRQEARVEVIYLFKRKECVREVIQAGRSNDSTTERESERAAGANQGAASCDGAADGGPA